MLSGSFVAGFEHAVGVGFVESCEEVVSDVQGLTGEGLALFFISSGVPRHDELAFLQDSRQNY